MGAKQSSELREALRLVREGMPGKEAAIKAGIRHETLYRNAEYKAIRTEQLAKLKDASRT